MAKPPKSRLDREIDEILEKKSREPIPFRPDAQARNKRAGAASEWQAKAARGWQVLLRMPLAMAYAFAFLGMLVHDASPLLALLLSIGAVAALWAPGVRNLIKPAATTTPTVKYWRGRPYVSDIKSAVSRSPIDSLKRYFDRRR